MRPPSGESNYSGSLKRYERPGMIRLLLVDDQPVFRNGLALLLKENSADFEVIGVTPCTGEAISKAQQLRPDIVIIGIGIKDSHSIDFIQLMADRFPDLKLLVMSASEEEDDLFRAIKAGASAYLLKTVDIKELAASIRRLTDGESVLSPLLVSKLFTEVRNDSTRKANYVHMLTRREKEILQCAALGCTNQEIAERCFITLATVKSHFRNVLKKLEVNNRTGAIALADACGLLEKPRIAYLSKRITIKHADFIQTPVK